MSIRENGTFVGALTLVGGAVVGAGIALLVAPRTGKNTRREIAITARKSGRRMKRAAREFSDSVSGVVDAASHGAADLLDKGREALHGVKRDLADALDIGQEMLSSQRERLGTLWR